MTQVSPSRRDDALRHTLTPRLVGLTAIGGVIGAGLFVGSASGLRTAGPLILPGYMLACLLVAIQMRMFADMTCADPDAGSFIGQIGKGLGVHAGFVAGWSYVLFWCTTAGSELIATGPLVTQLTGLPVWCGGAVAMGLSVIVNLISARTYARAESVLSLIKLMALVLFVLVGASSWLWGGAGGFRLSRMASSGIAPEGLGAALATVPILVQTLTGFEIATVAAVESADPAASVMYAARSLVWQVGFFYIAAAAVVLGIVPRADIVIGHSPFSTALDHLHFNASAEILTGVVLVAVVSCLNSALYVASRVVFELARTHDAPRSLGLVNRNGVPVRSVVLAAVLVTGVTACAAISPHGGYVIVLALSAAFILADYVLAGIAYLRLRPSFARRAGWTPMPGFPWAPRFAIACFATLLLGMLLVPSSRLDFLLGAGTLAVLTALAFAKHARRGGTAGMACDDEPARAG